MYYTFEAPLSGMSTNPARTFGSAFHASYWHALWFYFVAPSIGMMTAGEIFLRIRKWASHSAPNFTMLTTSAVSSPFRTRIVKQEISSSNREL
jgi:hypothetical protein